MSKQASAMPCAPLLNILGDIWSLAIIMFISKDALRFNELLRAIPQANPVTLAKRLKKLEEAGVLSKQSATLSKQSTVYSLTPKGRRLLPIIVEIQKVAKDFED